MPRLTAHNFRIDTPTEAALKKLAETMSISRAAAVRLLVEIHGANYDETRRARISAVIREALSEVKRR